MRAQQLLRIMPVLSLPTYDITIGSLALAHRQWLLERRYAGIVVLTDENTHRHCWPLLAPWLEGMPVQQIVVPAGEAHKHLDTCRRIWDELLAAGAGRRWCMLNLGGGVIGDMGGFCASTYKRGMDFVQLPTTLLSQVDASVGGKLGIDYGGVKNSIGVFREPNAVWIDPAFLDSLSHRELRSGFAEILKHALIADAGQWATLKALPDLSAVRWGELIPGSVAIKKEVVLVDFYETGPRKALNFGHTIGHAVESYRLDGAQPLLHGEAIAAGMVAEAWLSHRLAGLPEAELEEIATTLTGYFGHEPVPEEALPELLALMRQDKKNEADEINITFLGRIGEAIVNGRATEAEIAEAIRFYNQLG